MRFFFTLATFLFGICTISAQSLEIRWHNEASDTTGITEILKKGSGQHFATPGARTAWLAHNFLGKKYVAHTLEGNPEVLTINIDEVDCTTLVETIMALSFTLSEGREGWQDFVYNLRKLRYRGGEVNGYSSRLHYICDWAMDNIHRGNFTDATRDMPRCKYVVRSIDFMTNHRDSYAALKDSAQFERMRNVENGYRNHRFPYIKSSDINAKDMAGHIKEGDILAFVSNMRDLDVTHMGIAVKADDSELYLLHASSTEGNVVITDCPLADFMKRNRQWIGVRVFRLKE